MNQVMMKITDNKKIAEKTYFMSLEGDTSAITKPGQFINIKLDGFFLRRPISVCDCENGKLSIIYKVVGNGTKEMSELPVGAELDILSGLGNGYDTSKSGDCPVLIGGGVGVPPMYMLCKKLVSEGKKATVILGFNTEKEVYVTTADGSVGTKGFVTDVLKNLDYTYFYTCGPMPMFKAIESIAKTSGQYSFEERMGCGFGACMGCTCKTKYGNKRICKDGPVLEREEIVW